MAEIDDYGPLGGSAFGDEVAAAQRLCAAVERKRVLKGIEYSIDEDTGEVVIGDLPGVGTGIPEVDALNAFIRQQEEKGLSIILAWTPEGPAVVGAAERIAHTFNRG